MGKLNRRFQSAFTRWLDERFDGSAQAAAFASGLVVSPATLSNWRRGQEPSVRKAQAFFAALGEDPRPWLAMLADNRAAA